MQRSAVSHHPVAHRRREFEISGLEMIPFCRGPSQAPLSLAGSADCGLLVLWSRRNHNTP